jgi:YVTN family beta-propeller protein
LLCHRSGIGTVTVAAVVIVLIIGAVAYVVLTSGQGSHQVSSSTSSEVSTTSSLSTTSTTSSGTSTTSETTKMTSSSTANESVPTVSSVALGNVTINGYPGDIGIDANRSRIYVADLFANTLTVVDSSTRVVVKTITLPGTAEFGVAVDEKNGTVYIPVEGCTNEVSASNSCVSGSGVGPGEIVKVNESTETVVGTIPIGVDRLAIDQVDGVLYGAVGNPGPVNQTGFLIAINSQGSVIGNLSLGAYPVGLAVDSQRNTVWLAGCASVGLACKSEIIGVSGAPQLGRVQFNTSLPWDAMNFGVAVDEASNTVYTMGLTGSNLTLAAIYGANGTVRYLSPIGSSCAGGGGGTLAVDPSTGAVYAASGSGLFFLYLNGETGSIISMANETMGAQDVAFNPATDQPLVTLGDASHQVFGYLVFLPEVPSQFYVDASYLQKGICLP